MTQTAPITILLADDHEIYLDGLQSMLSKQPGLEVRGTASNGQQLIGLAKKQKPDIILTDILMPEMDGIEATRILSRDYPAINIIALSVFNEDNLIVDMLEAGAKGYLVKNAHKSEILEAIHTVHQNQPYYCRSTTTRLARLIARSKFTPESLIQVASFSDKEKEIIKLICEEKTSKEIAKTLYMGIRTVEGYRLKILEKMNVKSVAGIVVYAVKNGLYKVE
ncbi:MAG TPA: response regulator transcription factor [Puia sp.]|nr:response regulator transcription factor [Puia sp.]